MKIHKGIETTYRYNITDKMTCDICALTVEGDKWSNNEDVRKEFGNECDVSFNYSEGKSFREDGGWKKTYSLDICPMCFKHRIIPLLQKEYGVMLQTEEVDW